MCIAACDGGFHTIGTIYAQDRTTLSKCTIGLKSPSEVLTCCDTALTPPKFDVHFTVAPSSNSYKVVLACAGFRPEERAFKYGEDVSPSKPLDLGVVILRPFVARISDFSTAEQEALTKQYDPSTLVEVTKISDLPSDLKTRFKAWLGPQRANLPVANQKGDDPSELLGGFIVAGVNDSSALVAYEEYGYVPTTHATAYVHAKSDWIAVRKWDDVGYPKTLNELRLSLERFARPVSGH